MTTTTIRRRTTAVCQAVTLATFSKVPRPSFEFAVARCYFVDGNLNVTVLFTARFFVYLAGDVTRCFFERTNLNQSRIEMLCRSLSIVPQWPYLLTYLLTHLRFSIYHKRCDVFEVSDFDITSVCWQPKMTLSKSVHYLRESQILLSLSSQLSYITYLLFLYKRISRAWLGGCWFKCEVFFMLSSAGFLLSGVP